MEKIIIVGYGGHGKSVADSIERQGKYNIVGYTDCKEQNCKYKYLGTDKQLKNLYDLGIHNAVIGVGFVGKGNIRNNIYSDLKAIGYNLPVIIDPSAVISDLVQIGEGSFIGKSSVINVDAVVGKASIINTGAIIEHECQVGDFTHIAVGATICGQSEIDNGVFVGAGATIIQNISIGNGSIVGAGATVINDVGNKILVAGCPAKKIKDI